jgi:hypothetical protein
VAVRIGVLATAVAHVRARPVGSGTGDEGAGRASRRRSRKLDATPCLGRGAAYLGFTRRAYGLGGRSSFPWIGLVGPGPGGRALGAGGAAPGWLGGVAALVAKGSQKALAPAGSGGYIPLRRRRAETVRRTGRFVPEDRPVRANALSHRWWLCERGCAGGGGEPLCLASSGWVSIVPGLRVRRASGDLFCQSYAGMKLRV